MEDKAESIQEELIASDRFTLVRFIEKFTSKKKHATVFEFYDEVINDLTETGKAGNSMVYLDSKRALEKFESSPYLEFGDIDPVFLNRWKSFLLKRGTSPNTISVYMRTLRSLYNKAIVEGVAKQEDYPFGKRFSIKDIEQETSKRAIGADQIKEVIALTVEPLTKIWWARNYFLFSFFTMGMNFTDMAYLKWGQVKDGRIVYQRKKTGRYFSIKITQEAAEILNDVKVYTTNNKYVFPILNDDIHKTPEQKKTRIKTVLRDYNKSLKEIGKSLGISGLTSYVARHSWATIQKKRGISISLISEALGHTTERTTRIYLESFGDEELDRINENILG